jgi:predicted nucleic acid-binding protein
MIVFFDTSVHVAILRGDIEPTALLQLGTVRMSPVVASELLRGARTRTARQTIERLVANLVSIEPASWRLAWSEAGRVLSRIFADHEDVGLARLQNDCLIALTAHGTGATLVTRDRHFDALRRANPFSLETV